MIELFCLFCSLTLALLLLFAVSPSVKTFEIRNINLDINANESIAFISSYMKGTHIDVI